MGCRCHKPRPRRLSLPSLLGDPYLAGDDSFARSLLVKEPYATLGKLINTVGDARVALGKAAEFYRRAYDKVPDVTTAGGLQDQVRSNLDQGNGYAMRVYGELPDGSGALDTTTKGKVVEALKESIDYLHDAEESLKIQLDLLGALRDSLGSILGLPAALVPKILPGVKWWQVAIGAGVVVGGIVAARRLVK